MRLLYTTLLFSIALGLSSCGDSSMEKYQDPRQPVSVTVAQVASGNSAALLNASGTIDAVNSATLSTRMMGFVDKIHVRVGQKVTQGQLLVSINTADLAAQNAQAGAGIAEAQAAFDNADKNYKRFQNLFKDNSATQKELDDMKAHYDMAKARLEGAKQMQSEISSQYAYADLRAPFSGVITNRFIEEGNMANPGMPLIAVEGEGSYQVVASVPEKEIGKIQAGDKVSVMVKSINSTIPGKVSEVSASARNTGGQYTVKVILDKTDVKVLSGMYATVQFAAKADDTSAPTNITVPVEALVHRGELTGIYTVSQSDTAILRWLRLGRDYGEQVEVLSGLTVDEKYIVSADSKLYNGAKLTIK